MDTAHDSSELHYGSTLIFSIVCSNIDEQEMSTEGHRVAGRTFEKVSANLSQYGRWKCVFTETKRRFASTIELQLSLTWVPSPQALDKDHRQSPLAEELIGRIQSIKVRSDSALSELLVARLDGHSVLRGDCIQIKLQPGRVLRNGRYKFRVGFHTQDISRARFLEHPVFTSFLDLDTSFDLASFQHQEPPDVSLHFPVSRLTNQSVTLHTHSSVLRQSAYFVQRFDEVAQAQAGTSSGFSRITCTITEFSPAVVRTMLGYLYSGRLRLKKSWKQKITRKEETRLDTQGRERHIDLRADSCYFEDLYRIADRYEILPLRQLSLRAMQLTLSMALAISLLEKTQANLEIIKIQSGPDTVEMSASDQLEKAQVYVVVNIVKEYIQFFGADVFRIDGSEHAPSAQRRKKMIQEIGGCIIHNLSRLFE